MITMKNLINKLSFGCLLSTCIALTPQILADTMPFRDKQLPLEKRVDDLISRLTVEEKISQLFDKSAPIPRLSIPEYYWWNEALHGVARAGKATVFPQAIGLAATFDKDLMLNVATAISDEGRAKHHAFGRKNTIAMYGGLTYWSPNINIFRDPRWGRGQETYGEDPFLTSTMATSFVKGLEGDDPTYLKSVATIKHYAVHSGPEVSRHSDDYTASQKDLSETYLKAFKDTIAATDVSSVMCAYNRVNGLPACGSDSLLKDLLRDSFGFSGYVVSDCGAIADFYDENSHHVVTSPEEAAANALKAGTDLNCGDHHGNTFSYLKEALAQGLVEEQDIDRALTRLLTARIKLGMFDEDSSHPYTQLSESVIGSDKHIDLARRAAESSMVLLKNDGILPLKPSSKIALIGPNADNKSILVGNYHGTPIAPSTPKQAISAFLPEDKFRYAPGSSLTENIFAHFNTVPEAVFSHTNAQGQRLPGLVAKYYPASHFNLQPSYRQIEPNIDFSETGIPMHRQPNQEFAIRWHGLFEPQKTGNYAFNLSNVDVYLDDIPVAGSMYLEAGKTYSFRAESVIQQYWHSNVIDPDIRFEWVNTDVDLTAEAIQIAKESDVIVFVGGISAQLEGEEMALEIDGFSHGDRTHLALPKSQTKLLKALHKLGKPIVLVNMSGSAMALNWHDKNLNAIIQGFYPGEQTGPALVNILYGKTSPSGRLPVTFYSSVDDLPDFKDYSMKNRTYKYYTGAPLYPFGFGLSYTDFQYDSLALTREKDGLSISVAIHNRGEMPADEVVQVYLSMPDAPNEVPQRELAAFKRVSIKSGQREKIQFTLANDQLTYVDQSGVLQTYVGELQVSVGGGQGLKRKDNVVRGKIVLE
ncbi:beta-glucosidase [Alteromonas sp. ZYF713]|nr:beta-glucosidase [Alteromonas sp. ZYF713]